MASVDQLHRIFNEEKSSRIEQFLQMHLKLPTENTRASLALSNMENPKCEVEQETSSIMSKNYLGVSSVVTGTRHIKVLTTEHVRVIEEVCDLNCVS